MGLFFRVYEHLLPRSTVWRIKLETQLREFFEGLTGLPGDVRDFYDAIYGDSQPSTTREIPAWEKQFGLPDTGQTDAARRTRIAAAWEAVGGQSPRYVQDILQANGFNVFVHPWWEEPAPEPAGPYVVRNPFTYLSNGSPVFTVSCGEPTALCGEGLTLNPPFGDQLLGQTVNPSGFALVNKIATVTTIFLGCGDPEMECNEPLALDGQDLSITFGERVYLIPTDPVFWPYFLYIGAATFPEHATVAASRRDEFEELALKICPGQQWLGMLIDYA